MSEKCSKCGTDIGWLSTIEVENKKYCAPCSKVEQHNKEIDKIDKNLYIPDPNAIKRALSALLTQDSDTKKLFEEGSRTYVKLFGGDINNFINLNANLISASTLMAILEKLDSLDRRLAAIIEEKR